jgi:membrane fusion protein, multidrug efflux system
MNETREKTMSLFCTAVMKGWRKTTLSPPKFLLLLALSAAFLSGCSKDVSGIPKTEDPKKKTAVPVTIGKAVSKDMPIQFRAIGNVEAYSTVGIKAQVEGELTIIHFKEGQEVKAGELLFTIDPRSYAVQLKQAEATLAKDTAQLLNARRQVERYGSVAQKGYVSRDQYDQITSNEAALEAQIKGDEATVENARLKLSFCTIQSPLTGVVGGIRVHRGTIIKANDNDKPIVFVNQIKPIYVSFSVPERYLTEIRKYMAVKNLDVQAFIPGSGGTAVRGELAFIENTVDTNTGSILLKALFPNEDKVLWPGQFVNVTLNLSTRPGAILVPAQAIQAGQEGPYLFVVRDDSTVEYRKVSVDDTIGGETIVTQGVTAGEEVVTDGQLRLDSKSLVKPVE